MDILSDILQTMKLRGTVYFRASFHAPWGMAIPAGEFANFHIVTGGSCWLRAGSHPATELLPGDIVMFPHGSAHALTCSPEARTMPANVLLEDTLREADNGIAFGGDGNATTTMICGHFEYDRKLPHPLFDTLDDTILVRTGGDAGADWVSTAAELAARVGKAAGPGVDAVVDRLAEALFIQAITAWVSEREDATGFIRAVGDHQVGRALALIHDNLEADWTLSSLAAAAAMSRSRFAERFKALVGEPPIVYLARWRMLRAREMLVQSRRPVAEISHAVGYQSEFAFARAFKKIIGETPGAVRRKLAGA